MKHQHAIQNVIQNIQIKKLFSLRQGKMIYHNFTATSITLDYLWILLNMSCLKLLVTKAKTVTQWAAQWVPGSILTSLHYS